MAVTTITSAVDLPHPPEAVWSWTTDLRYVNAICYPLLEIRYDLSDPPWLYDAAVIPVEMRIAGVHADWATMYIRTWQPYALFIDEGIADGQRRWRHEHAYLPIDGGTRYVDRLTVDVGPALSSGGLMIALFLKWRQRNLRRLLSRATIKP
ncbi:MAG TPA: hypothetical protein VFZ66_27105 [Herpetosiphonaceae bacterium]